MEISCYCVVSDGSRTIRAKTVVTGNMTLDEDCVNNNDTSDKPTSAKRARLKYPEMDEVEELKQRGDEDQDSKR